MKQKPKESWTLYICSPGLYSVPLILQEHALVEVDDSDVVNTVVGGSVLVIAFIEVPPGEVVSLVTLDITAVVFSREGLVM